MSSTEINENLQVSTTFYDFQQNSAVLNKCKQYFSFYISIVGFTDEQFKFQSLQRNSFNAQNLFQSEATLLSRNKM